MFLSKVFGLIQLSKPINPLLRSHINSNNIKLFSITSKIYKDISKKEEKQLSELEQHLKRILSESIDPSSPFSGLIQRWVSKPWIKFFGDKTLKSISIKERKETKPLKDGMFRIAFDLAGFEPEEIRVILSETAFYIEAKKEETTNDGAKCWREYSYHCPISKHTNPDSVCAFIDSGGLLVIEGDLPKDTLTGMKKPK